jgi:glycine/serine hydroxymethyltransferase
VGTAAQTTAGMREAQFEAIATFMARALRQRADESALLVVRDEVAALCADFNPYGGFTK